MVYCRSRRSLLVSLVCLPLIAGCGVDRASMNLGSSQVLHGMAHGGNQPVAGATIQLYAVGTSADGGSSTPLLTSAVVTDPNGYFTITTLYPCTTPGTEVYLVATGGNPGLGGAATNPNLAMMSALGPCGNLTSSTFLTINEVTTVAAVFTLLPYMNSYSAVGSTSGHAAALATAFATIPQIVDPTLGQAPGPALPAGAIAPTLMANTLANMLVPCVNSPGGVASDGSLCGSLFGFAKAISGTAPTDTVGAMIAIARNPSSFPSILFTLVPASPPFQPTLAVAPAAWSVNVLTLQSLAVTPATVTVNTGSTVQLTATGTYSDGSTQNASNTVTWSSANSGLAKVNAGLVTGVAGGGPVTVTASAGSVSGTSNVTVSPVSLVSIAITPANSGVFVGSSAQFTATGTFSNGTTAAIPSAVWTSSKPTVATISSAGVALGVAAGVSTITATVNGITANTQFTVSIVPPTLYPILVSFSADSCTYNPIIFSTCTFSYYAINLTPGVSYFVESEESAGLSWVQFVFTASASTYTATGVAPTYEIGHGGIAGGISNGYRNLSGYQDTAAMIVYANGSLPGSPGNGYTTQGVLFTWP